MTKKIDYSVMAQLSDALGQVCALFEFGKSKYPNRAWNSHKNMDEVNAFLKARTASLSRHVMLAMQDIRSKDDESGAHHLAAVAWNALVLLQLQLDNLETESGPINISRNKFLEMTGGYGRHMAPVPEEDPWQELPTSLETSDLGLNEVLVDDPDDVQIIRSFDGGGEHIYIPRELYCDLAPSMKTQLVVNRETIHGHVEKCYVFVDVKR